MPQVARPVQHRHTMAPSINTEPEPYSGSKGNLLSFDPRASALPPERRQYWPHPNGISALPFPLPRDIHSCACGICGRTFRNEIALKVHRDVFKSTLTLCVPSPSRTRRARV